MTDNKPGSYLEEQQNLPGKKQKTKFAKTIYKFTTHKASEKENSNVILMSVYSIDCEPMQTFSRYGSIISLSICPKYVSSELH